MYVSDMLKKAYYNLQNCTCEFPKFWKLKICSFLELRLQASRIWTCRIVVANFTTRNIGCGLAVALWRKYPTCGSGLINSKVSCRIADFKFRLAVPSTDYIVLVSLMF